MTVMKLLVIVTLVTVASVFCQVSAAGDLPLDGDDQGLEDGGQLAPRALKRSARNRGIDMCLCCARKQLSFCCHACIQRHVSVVSANVLDNRDLSLTDRMLSYKLSSLRMSACSCCAQTANPYSRCCLWCGTMEHL